MPREDSLVAGRAAAAAKFKTKKPSAKTLKVYERAAAAAEKKAVAAEAVAATAGEARARATKARARLTAASAPSERHAASGHLGNEAQINGTVKRVKPSWRFLSSISRKLERLTSPQLCPLIWVQCRAPL